MSNKILEILQSVRPELDFQESSNFILDGYLDSFYLVLLVSSLEKEFNISINSKNIIPDNFISIESIAKLIKTNQI